MTVPVIVITAILLLPEPGVMVNLPAVVTSKDISSAATKAFMDTEDDAVATREYKPQFACALSLIKKNPL